jgi:DNA-directed RNA polymerase subunit E'/Rpb7
MRECLKHRTEDSIALACHYRQLILSIHHDVLNVRNNVCLSQVEGTCSERYGFVLRIFSIDIERLEGRINPTGMHPGGTAVFTVPYDAIVFKPFKGEVLCGIVSTCAQQGLFVQCGPLLVRLTQLRLVNKNIHLHSPLYVLIMHDVRCTWLRPTSAKTTSSRGALMNRPHAGHLKTSG